jgi:hypothetical protein
MKEPLRFHGNDMSVMCKSHHLATATAAATDVRSIVMVCIS